MNHINQTDEERRQAALERMLKDPNLKPSDKEFFRAAFMMQQYVEDICNRPPLNPNKN